MPLFFSVAGRAGLFMIFDLSNLFDGSEEPISLDCTADLSHVDIRGEKPFPEPVKVKGSAFSRAGMVVLSLNLSWQICLPCDRCLTPLSLNQQADMEHIAVRSLQSQDSDSDEYILVPDAKLDMDELVCSDLLLSLPAQVLCKKDCKGLCPVCGADKNYESCSCGKETGDPRLAKLKELLQD